MMERRNYNRMQPDFGELYDAVWKSGFKLQVFFMNYTLIYRDVFNILILILCCLLQMFVCRNELMLLRLVSEGPLVYDYSQLQEYEYTKETD